MKKKIITLFSALAVLALQAQSGRVGINTTNPRTTLDVNGLKDSSGKSISTDPVGLQAPRLTLAELVAKGNSVYTEDQKAAIIYISDVSGGIGELEQAINIDTPGYYYFDGAVWLKVGTGVNRKTLYIASTGSAEVDLKSSRDKFFPTGAQVDVSEPGYYLIQFKVVIDKSPDSCGPYLAMNLRDQDGNLSVSDVIMASSFGPNDYMFSSTAAYLKVGKYDLLIRYGGECDNYKTKAEENQNSVILTLIK